MKTILLTFFSALLVCLAQAQAPSLTWQQAYGGSQEDFTRAIALTPDGGFAFLAAVESNDGDVAGSHGLAEYWFVKVSAAGNIEWQKCYGGTHDDYGWDMQVTADGGYILTGYSNSHDGDVTGNHGNFDYWVIKITPAGIIQWEQSYGGSAYEAPYGIEQTTDHGYVIAGTTVSHDGDVIGAHSNKDAWIIKIDSNGLLQWQKDVGGIAIDDAFDVEQTTDGSYIVAGNSASFNGDISGGHGSDDFLVFKLSSEGVLDWTHCYGGTGSEVARSIRQTEDGGFVVLGWTDSNDGDVSGNHGKNDIWLIKINASGTLLWQKCLGGSQDEFGRVLRIAADGGYLVAGPSASSDGNLTINHGGLDYWLVKLDTARNINWQTSVGGSDDEYAYTFEYSGNDYYMGGLSKSANGDVTLNHGAQDVWIAKLSATCNLSLSHTVVNESCSGNDASIDLSVFGGIMPFTYQWSNGATSQDLSAITAGTYSVTVTDVNGCSANETIAVTGTTIGVPVNLSTIKITATSAKPKWTVTGTPTGFDVRYKLTSSAIWLHKNVSGGNKTTVALTNLQPSSQYEWQIKEKCGAVSSSYSSSQLFTTASMREAQTGNECIDAIVYPNPTGGILNISMKGSLNSRVNIQIVDLTGRIVFSEIFNDLHDVRMLELDLNALTNGSYQMLISNGSIFTVKPVVVAR